MWTLAKSMAAEIPKAMATLMAARKAHPNTIWTDTSFFFFTGNGNRAHLNMATTDGNANPAFFPSFMSMDVSSDNGAATSMTMTFSSSMALSFLPCCCCCCSERIGLCILFFVITNSNHSALNNTNDNCSKRNLATNL